MNSTNKTNQILGGTKEGNENIFRQMVAKQAAILEPVRDVIERFVWECGTWLDTEEKRQQIR